AGWATPTTRGKIYGFHRGMDHIGAIVGPSLATLFLFMYPDRYRTLFALTIIPGAIAVALILLVSEPEAPAVAKQSERAVGTSSDGAGTTLPRSFTMFMLVLALFTLGNSTDAFLLLKLTDAAGSAEYVPLMYAALHVVKASVSMLAGSWSDRI